MAETEKKTCGDLCATINALTPEAQEKLALFAEGVVLGMEIAQNAEKEETA